MRITIHSSHRTGPSGSPPLPLAQKPSSTIMCSNLGQGSANFLKLFKWIGWSPRFENYLSLPIKEVDWYRQAIPLWFSLHIIRVHCQTRHLTSIQYYEFRCRAYLGLTSFYTHSYVHVLYMHLCMCVCCIQLYKSLSPVDMCNHHYNQNVEMLHHHKGTLLFNFLVKLHPKPESCRHWSFCLWKLETLAPTPTLNPW